MSANPMTPPHAYPCSCALCDDAAEAREDVLNTMFANAVFALEDIHDETMRERWQLLDELSEEMTESEWRLVLRSPFVGPDLARKHVHAALRRVIEKRLGGGS